MSRVVFRLFLALLVALLLIIGVSFLMPGATRPTAQVHPEAASLLQSTGSLAERPEVLGLGYVMGVLMIAIMAVAVWIGLRKRDGATPLNRWMMAAFAGYALVFTALVAAYASYTQGHETAFFGGFPAPTAWMIYGMWLFPLVFVGLYMALFDRWVLTDQDLARFDDLVKENRRRGGTA
ncbi:MAG: hypothetical protein IH820_10625 [Bacteroidetes bacterium]|nr:hypothetical protein [Bacteroidota bacterium]